MAVLKNSMESKPVIEPTHEDSQETMVNLVTPPSSSEVGQGDMAKSEPHRNSQEWDTDVPEVARSSKELVEDHEGLSAELQGLQTDSESFCVEKEDASNVRNYRTSIGDFDSKVEESLVECEDKTVVLVDGSVLQSETDVDVFSAGELSTCEVKNKFHNISDLSSMSPSISTDKTVTSSPLSSLSIDGDSLRSTELQDSTLSSSVMFHKSPAIPSASFPSRALPEVSVSEGSECDSAVAKPKVKENIEDERQSLEAGGINTSVADDSLSPQAVGKNSGISALQTGNGDVDESISLNHNTNDAHSPEEVDENVNSDSLSEPFSVYVDVCHLRTDLAAESSGTGQSGNVQEQQLLSVVNSLEEPRSRKRLKKLLRSGLWTTQSTVRRVAWLQVCSHLHKLEKAFVYLQMEKELFGDVEDEDIPVPSWPQQPVHEDHMLTEYYLTPKGKNTAHKIVTVIGQLSPDITYSPGLLPLVDLFLHYMDEANCFSCVLTLLQSKGPIYLMQSRVAYEASKRVMKDLAKKYAKSAYVSLVRSCKNVDSVFDNWMGWIYSDLPFNYVVAVTDSYLMEGIKVLYRVVLAIISMYHKHARHAPASSNVAHSISLFCRNLPVSPAKLLKEAFKIRGFSRRKLLTLQNRHEDLITSGPVSFRNDLPRVASSQSIGDMSMAVSTAVSMAHPSTRMMGFHDTGSNILTVDQLATIWSWLPPRYAIYQPNLVFNSADLGTSLMTLYAHIEHEPCTVIIIKTVEGEVFGAFCADPWVERRTYSRPVRYFGIGETFLFTLVPERVKYEWVGKPDPHVPLSANMFQAGDNTSLMIGGGSGCGIQLDAMMERCRTETCDTFSNPPLCCAEDFVPAAIEVFGLM